MKATGIVRRIDDLGRVVIPKEIRRTMRIREGDPLEIYTDNDGEVIFKKYSPIASSALSRPSTPKCCNAPAGTAVVVCDRDHVIAVAGLPKKELLERRVSPSLEELMETRHPYALTDGENSRLQPVEGWTAMHPLQPPSWLRGCLRFHHVPFGGERRRRGEAEVKLIAVAAGFLGKQMEE